MRNEQALPDETLPDELQPDETLPDAAKVVNGHHVKQDRYGKPLKIISKKGTPGFGARRQSGFSLKIMSFWKILD